MADNSVPQTVPGTGVIERIAGFEADLVAIRHDLHAHPETAFEEHRTAERVAGVLQGLGIEVHRGLAGTGVVGTLRAGSSGRAIGLRADMDALAVEESNDFDHRSCHAGRMHACGHDGHTAMLLGAARYLAETCRFDGTVRFIFQPAEENEGGGEVMVREGLFERFPVDAVFGMHNWPGLPAGEFALRAGPLMAGFNLFEIHVRGAGAHAAMPHQGIDPLVAGSALVQALQTLTSRNLSPLDSGVVSVTQIHGGDTWNVIPPEVVIRGTTRAFKPAVQDLLEQGMRRLSEGIAAAHGCSVSIRYERRYPALVNHAAEAGLVREVLDGLVGAERVHWDYEPTMGGEDFAFMLQERPGCFVFIGNGPAEGGCMLHNPRYDFNDAILTLGASYWSRLVEHCLPEGN
jgi:amidohydrolase